MSNKRAGHAPALFDDASFAEDLQRLGDAGREVALRARNSFEESGVPVQELRACDEEGPKGTALPHCVKVRLPFPDGKFGMVFRIELRHGKSALAFAAFGARHQPHNSHAPTVYDIAHRRLHE